VFQGFQKLNNPLSDSLNCLIVEVELYRVIVRPVGNHLVCICADSNTGLGILKLKLNSLTESLNRL
jgi:predicted regulator of Ras-like GTPase activity (Roadblock/LC7/MglB family)